MTVVFAGRIHTQFNQVSQQHGEIQHYESAFRHLFSHPVSSQRLNDLKAQLQSCDGDVLAQTLTSLTGLPFATRTDGRSKLLSRLQFVSTHDGQAIASWGGYSTHGRLAAWLKRNLDRSRMASYRAS